MLKPTPEQVVATLAERGSIRKTATALSVPRSSLQDWIAEWSEQDTTFAERLNAARNHGQRMRPEAHHKPGLVLKDGQAIATGDPLADGLQTRDAERYLRERWGLPEDEWVNVSVTVNEWQGPVAGGGAQTFAQAKGSFRKIADVALVSPAVHVPELIRPKPVRRAAEAPRLYVVEGDHQAPYFDPALDAAATAMVADLQPERHVFLGDLMDFPTISRHADHPAAMANVKECLEAGYGILRRRAEAAPNAERFFLKGNHDWRLESELLLRAERMANITPVGEDEPALSLRRLLHLDKLGVELVTDPRGWEHAEVDLVPGRKGLVVRHGWLTGANTGKRSLDKRGRSLLVGHGHGREHYFAWDPSAETERQAAMVGTMSRTRDVVFPHFATCDDWLQGLATVTVWPSGRFVIEHARWEDGALYWRDRAWRP
jgi:hypothetical protein